MIRIRFIILILFFCYSHLLANNHFTSQDTIFAVRSKFTIIIDGLLNEPVWNERNGISGFTQSDPIEGAEPSFRTVMWVAYDDDALYIAADMYDPAPDSIIARLGRKDTWLDSDGVGFFLDPYLDRRSGYYFVMNAGGTYYDGVLMNDEWDDNAWDGVWEGKTAINDSGWTAEFRIPFSQLRFHKQDKYYWGINFRRDIQRKNEILQIVFTPKDSSGFVSRFPILAGIEQIKSSRGIEILPYARLKAEYLQVDEGNPFNDGSRLLPGFGVDMKIGIGNNLTLDGTINPDFGQVEVDPAIVNLSDVETFFPERRPFFIEGESIFRFGSGGSRRNIGINWGRPRFFYSRRIGHAPQGTDDLPDYDHIDIPEGTSILGAGKLTGKISDWNIGSVLALTNREYADLDLEGKQSQNEVEPLTGWGVLRAQKEVDNGFQGLGLIATGVTRDFKDQILRDQMNSQSYSLGLDGWTFLDDERDWVLTAWGGMSYVKGNQTRLTSIQENSQHYFQRPDAGHVSVDTNANSLTGYAARLMINKQQGSAFLNSAIGFIDPKFEVNDAGFFRRSDLINWHVAGGYEWNEPGEIFRRVDLTFASFTNFDFDKNLTGLGFFHFGWVQFLNYYRMDWALGYFPRVTDNRNTRGGPLMVDPAGMFVELEASSDSRKDWVFGISGERSASEFESYAYRIQLSIQWKPLSNIFFSFEPGYSWNVRDAQYVDQIEDEEMVPTYGKRYVFAELDQKTLSTDIRINWTFTPKLSFQLYMQPLFAIGSYTNYKELARPNSYEFNVYDPADIDYEDGDIIIYPDGRNSTTPPFVISDPNFNFRSLRGNAVLRWEYLPGSIFYLVWTQNRYYDTENGNYAIDKSIVNIWDTTPDNIYMIKWTYWLNL